MENLLHNLKTLLQKDERLVSQGGEILKNKAQELAWQNDPELLKLLLSDEKIKNTFFFAVDKTLIFDKEKFIRFISNKQFLPDSYTAFKNKIGLTVGDEYLSESKEVVLAWPYKDCVLEGGMTKEDQKRDEIFYNEALAPDDIDRLFDPKVFTNFKRIDNDGEHALDGFCRDENGTITDNLIIKGNNLLALYSLKKQFAGKVKLIYIDPPYNTGNDSFGYNNHFNHSSWLAFMKNRLEVAKELLRNDGSIWINIDDTEAHYLKVLCDEVFGRDNFMANVVWQKKYSPQNDAKYFSDNHDHILVFSKDKTKVSLNLIERSDKAIARYKNPDNDPRGPWKPITLHAKSGNNTTFKYKFKGGYVWRPPSGTFPRFSKETIERLEKENKIWFGKSGNSAPSVKNFLSEIREGVVPLTVWTYQEVGHNHEAKEETKKIFGENLFASPKPERLIQRIFEIGSNEDDIVLDFFAGSGTTGAVAMKTRRQFILCEQMDYAESVTVERLKKVIAGEQGGISEAVDWKGGGDFVYLELMKWNENFVERIQEAKTKEELKKLWETIKKKAFLSYKVDIKAVDENAKDFADLSIEDQKRFLLECLDKNHLYVNYSEIEDDDYRVSEEDKTLNREFYVDAK
jgi:adenine-specific DNA-methyltransferase